MKIKALVNPLSSVHSEVYSLCICDLYASFYGPKADFSATHTQDNLKQMIHSILDSNQALCASLEIYERKAKANE
uniref:hypothetical protein n=1 Tax=Vibrio vulnificus TaxID=672 RepID=UPI0039B54501